VRSSRMCLPAHLKESRAEPQLKTPSSPRLCSGLPRWSNWVPGANAAMHHGPSARKR